MTSRCAGQLCLKQNACALLIAAGGQGSRLGASGPKGCYPITPIRRHSLFQRIAEKVFYASKLYKQTLSLAIMTSRDNDAATKAHFIQNRFFGLLPRQVDFFIQPELPFLDASYHPICNEHGIPITAPDGNGSIFAALQLAGILDKWINGGIGTICFLPIDNPLADPFDLELIGLQREENADVALTVIPRLDPKESVGLVKEEGGKLRILEYSELTQEDQRSTQGFANTNLFCFSIDFVKKSSNLNLPIHYAHKKIFQNGKEIQGLKQERFIFDLFPYATKSVSLKQARSDCFAPLKNAEGPCGPLAVQEALISYDRKVLSMFLEKPVLETVLELSPCFYYPEPELKRRWLTAAQPLDGYYGEFP